MLATLYIETTIPSYLTAWPAADLIRAAHQKITKDWWALRRDDFIVYISQLVLDEVAEGDPSAAQDRLKALEGVPILPVTVDSQKLAEKLIRDLVLPAKAVVDAAHIAVAACNGIDFLLTWNCKHINNAELIPKIEQTCRLFGLVCPVICTPEELMGL